MKIQGETYQTMHNAIKAVVEHHGLEKIKEVFQGQSQARTIWSLWNLASNQLMFDDNHPAFQNGTWTRIFPYAAFDIYKVDESINDAHIQTAVKHILKSIGVL